MVLTRILLAFLTIQFISCSKPERRKDSAPSQSEVLQAAREGISLWAEKCSDGVSKKNCGDGDATLWNGLLCGSGDEFGCNAVRAAQSEDGRVWRSPRLKNNDPIRTFSRDMGMGTLVFLARSKDVAFGNKWSAFINSEKRLCESGNGSCTISPAFYWVYNTVAESVGFTKLNSNVVYSLAGVDEAWLYAQAHTTPSGYQTHLVGVHLYIRLILDKWNDTLQRTADVLHNREPSNIFFEYLSNGKGSGLAGKLIKKLPYGPTEKRSQWCWERTDSENACQDSMGWDFIFAINLMLN